LKTGAFKNADGSIAVVVINSAASEQTVSLALDTAGMTAQAWYTDETHDMSATEVTLSDAGASATVSARGMISFLFSPASNSTAM
jgi:hypothetical protein